jgi:hypothetical protein
LWLQAHGTAKEKITTAMMSSDFFTLRQRCQW